MIKEIPSQLQEIVENFQWAEGREKLEMLLEYAEQLPPLPARLQEKHAEMDQVPECMTPVFVDAELQDGKLQYFFDVPKESPTVRGFAALMAQGLNGTTPPEVLQVPNDFFHAMGLQDVLTHQRLNGMSVILAHMKQLAARHL